MHRRLVLGRALIGITPLLRWGGVRDCHRRVLPKKPHFAKIKSCANGAVRRPTVPLAPTSSASVHLGRYCRTCQEPSMSTAFNLREEDNLDLKSLARRWGDQAVKCFSSSKDSSTPFSPIRNPYVTTVEKDLSDRLGNTLSLSL